MNNPPEPGHRADIDGLRAVAVLAVLAFHLFPALLPGGFVGVDVFFVISGFLISGILFRDLDAGRFHLGSFYGRRVRRIFPALATVLASGLLLGWFLLLPDEYAQLGRHVAGGVGFVSNFVLWNEAGYFDSAAHSKPLLHLWSLGIEEQFYLGYPLLLRVLWRLGAGVLPGLALVALGSFLLNLTVVTGGDLEGAFYAPATRVWELLVGALLAYTARAGRGAPGGWRQAAGSWGGTALLGAALLLIEPGLAFPGGWALLPTLGTALLIGAGEAAPVNRRLLSHPLLRWVGLVSYPLYLWHWLLLSLVAVVESGSVPLSWRLGVMAASFGLAQLTFVMIERPARHGPRGGRTIALLCAAMLGLAALGLAVDRAGGVPSRAAAALTDVNRFGAHEGASYRESCAAHTGEVYRDDWCNAGTRDGRPVRVLLLGDSVANAYSTMFASHAASSPDAPGFLQLARGQCPSLRGYGPPPCQRLAELSHHLVETTPALRDVVFALNWPAYLDPRTTRWYRSHPETPASFRAALLAEIAAYRALGRRVSLLLPPTNGTDPRSCGVRAFRFTSRDLCQLSTAQVRERERGYREFLDPIVAEYGLRTFDPMPLLCEGEVCRIVDGKRVLFVDEVHLSPAGGEVLAQRGAAALRALFDDPPP